MAITKIRGETQILDESIFDAQIAPTAAIQLSKIQNGTQIILANGSVAMTAPLNMGSNAITNLAAPTNGTDAANKAYVDAQSQGLDFKNSCRVGTTVAGGDITLATAPAAIDGITLTSGDRVLVKNQTDPTENGIYIFNGTGNAMTRATDADTGTDLNAGAFTYLEQGTVNAGSSWVMITTGVITLGTSNIVWSQFSAAGAYTAGNGLQLIGNQFSILLDGSTLSVSGSGIKLADLTSGNILVGNGSNVASSVTMSGDVTINNTGVTAISANVVTAADMVRQASGQLLIGQGAGSDLAWTSVTGDVTISAGGVTAIAANVVTPADLARQTAATIAIGQGAGADIAWQAISGDATLSTGGVLTIATSTFITAHYVRYEVPSGLINGTNVTFTIANTPLTDTVDVYLNGQLLVVGAGNDYTISGTTVTMAQAPKDGGNPDVVWVKYWK